jgi:hypothetical protein
LLKVILGDIHRPCSLLLAKRLSSSISETIMNLTAKTLSALLLGAALITPALAQDAVSANNGNSATAQSSPNTAIGAADTAAQAAPSAAPTTPVDKGTTTASNTMPSGTSQMAMNTTGNASDLSSVPDTQKKYSRSSRAKDYRTEAAVTAQLNQKESSMSGTSAQ